MTRVPVRQQQWSGLQPAVDSVRMPIKLFITLYSLQDELRGTSLRRKATLSFRKIDSVPSAQQSTIVRRDVKVKLTNSLTKRFTPPLTSQQLWLNSAAKMNWWRLIRWWNLSIRMMTMTSRKSRTLCIVQQRRAVAHRAENYWVSSSCFSILFTSTRLSSAFSSWTVYRWHRRSRKLHTCISFTIRIHRSYSVHWSTRSSDSRLTVYIHPRGKSRGSPPAWQALISRLNSDVR